MVGGDILFWFYLQFHKLILVTITYARDAFLARYALPFPSCRLICRLQSSPRRAVASSKKSNTRDNSTIIHSRIEMDSHADTIVAGSNCVVLNYTGQVCDVSPYRDDYAPIENVPVVHTATAW